MQFCEISYNEENSFGLAKFPQVTGDVKGMNVAIENEFGNQLDQNAICQMLMKMHFKPVCEKDLVMLSSTQHACFCNAARQESITLWHNLPVCEFWVLITRNLKPKTPEPKTLRAYQLVQLLASLQDEFQSWSLMGAWADLSLLE